MIYIYGDSHARFSFADPPAHWPKIVNNHVCCSTMNAVVRDKRVLQFEPDSHKPDSILVFAFGEIDCRRHVKIQMNKGRDEDEIIHTLATGYISVLQTLVQQTPHRMAIVVAVVPPMDTSQSTDFFVGTNEERLRFTTKLNALLSNLCDQLIFFDPYDSPYRRADGLLAQELSDGIVHVQNSHWVFERLERVICAHRQKSPNQVVSVSKPERVLSKGCSCSNKPIIPDLSQPPVRVVALYIQACGLKVDEFIRVIEMFFEIPKEEMRAKYGLEFVDPTQNNTFTHALFMDIYTPPPDVVQRISAANIIGFSLEPKIFFWPDAAFARKLERSAKIFISGQRLRLRNSRSGFSFVPTPWHLAVPALPVPLQQRSGHISFPFSHKKDTPNHRYRHELALALLQDPRHIQVDFWGSGTESLQVALGHVDSRIKTKFDNVEPYVSYKAAIAIENCEEQFYLTEKFVLPIYCGCVPLYLGCPKIDQFFPNGYVKLTGNVTKDVDLIASLAAPQLEDVKIHQARQFFIDHWNWPVYVKSLFDS